MTSQNSDQERSISMTIHHFFDVSKLIIKNQELVYLNNKIGFKLKYCYKNYKLLNILIMVFISAILLTISGPGFSETHTFTKSNEFDQKIGPEKSNGAILYIFGKSKVHITSTKDILNRDDIPSFLKKFRSLGWDIFLFMIPIEFHMDTDNVRLLDKVHNDTVFLQTMGYRKVILAGQSWGAALSLIASHNEIFSIDGILAISPTFVEESPPSAKDIENSLDFFAAFVKGKFNKSTKIAIVLFEDDEFVPSRILKQSLGLFFLRQSKISNLFILPKSKSLLGHYAYVTEEFSESYVLCINQFFILNKNSECPNSF
jgi:hypothetical protein